MDATIVNLAIYLTATFAAALVTGVAVCFRIGRRRDLAAYPHANPDGDIDHRLRFCRAGYFGLEITACVAMASAVAVLIRWGLRRPFGCCDSRLDPA